MSRTVAARAERDGYAGDSAEADAVRAERLERLGRALDELGEKERLAIHLYYLESDPVSAAVSALGMSRSGFYKLLNRAREQLAGLMSEASPSS